jgi:ABC-type hemin transport system substrate-binding protein
VSDQPQQQVRLRYRLPIELLLLVFAGAWLSRRVPGMTTASPAGVGAVTERVEAMGNLGRMVGVPQTGSEPSR